MRVVADAFFAKAPFINWILGISVHVITRMRKDAVGWDDPEPEPPLPPGKKKLGRPRTKPRKGKEWKLADLLKKLTPECVTVFIYGKLRTFHVVTRDVWVRDVIQKVRVVVIQTIGDPIIFLSTDLTLTARQIIILYSMRFAAELGIRDAKQHCGTGHAQRGGTKTLGQSVSDWHSHGTGAGYDAGVEHAEPTAAAQQSPFSRWDDGA